MIKSSNYIKKIINSSIDIAIVTGSGLSDIKNILDDKIIIFYSEVPDYFNTTVEGHEGQFIFGTYNNHKILIAVGRFHIYEGLSLDEVGLPIRIFHELDCKKIILTNSSGCLVPSWSLGDIMALDGHYDFTFRLGSENPKLIGGNEYYNKELINLTKKVYPHLKIGKYGWVLGPAYETKAEIQSMKIQGVNAVGMSTVPEVLMAHRLGVTILVLALMSNYAVGLSNDTLSHQIVLQNSIKYNKNFKLLLISILNNI